MLPGSDDVPLWALAGTAFVVGAVPLLLVVAAAAALNIFRPVTNDVLASVLDPIRPGSLAAMMTLNLVFFLVGVHYKKWGAWVAARANWPTLLLLGSALIAAGIYRLNTPDLWEHTFLPLSIGWIVWAIMAAAIATRWVAPQELGSYLGARTLPIYVMQFPLLFLIPWGLQLYATGALQPAWVQALFPLAVTGFIVLVALVLHTWVQGNRLRYLFTAPEWALNPRAARWNTWVCSPARRLPIYRWKLSGSALVQMAVSRTCGQLPILSKGARYPNVWITR